MGKVDWTRKARLTRLRDQHDMPQATPRIAACRKCNADAAGAGMLYCETHRSEMTIEELLAAGEHHGDWRVGRNRLGNPIWERDT